MDLNEMFEKLIDDDQLHKFDQIETKFSQRRDLHAFIFLDKKFPKGWRILGGADHDIVWLSVTEDELSSLTQEDVLELIRCGVHWDSDSESLAMFV